MNAVLDRDFRVVVGTVRAESLRLVLSRLLFSRGDGVEIGLKSGHEKAGEGKGTGEMVEGKRSEVLLRSNGLRPSTDRLERTAGLV